MNKTEEILITEKTHLYKIVYLHDEKEFEVLLKINSKKEGWISITTIKGSLSTGIKKIDKIEYTIPFVKKQILLFLEKNNSSIGKENKLIWTKLLNKKDLPDVFCIETKKTTQTIKV